MLVMREALWSAAARRRSVAPQSGTEVPHSHGRQDVLVGVISDTHGLLRPEALTALRAVDHIIHAGDVGSPEVLEELRHVAPVTAVRGNVDTEEWARPLPATNEWACSPEQSSAMGITGITGITGTGYSTSKFIEVFRD